MPNFHTVVFIDHKEALVFELRGDEVTEHCIEATDRHGNIHHKSGSLGSGHTHDSKNYLTAVVDVLNLSQEILIVGHGNAKDELASFIREHAHILASRIMGIRPMDQPTKGEIVAFARKFFKSNDLTTPQLAN